MMDKLAQQHIGHSDDLEKLKEYDEFTVNIVHHICFDSLRGVGKDYNMFNSKTKDRIVSTTIMLNRNLEYYQDYIETYLKSEVMPINVAFIKDMIMEAVSHSDTDSTCGWYGDRVQDRFGKMEMGAKGVGYFSIYMMFNSGVVSHLLRQLTTNFNVEGNKRDKLAMKNEYYFPVFGSANVTKHYIANMMIKEGLVYQEPKLDIKGNTLISSNSDKYIRDHFTNMVRDVSNILTKGDRLDSEKVIGNVADLERSVISKLRTGDASVFKLEKINTTYKAMKSDPSKWTSTNIYHHELYKEVFSTKYGSSGDLPYLAVGIPLKEENLKGMINDIKDIGGRDRLEAFFKKHPKGALKRILYPLSIISTKGLPEELKEMVDEHKLITTLLKPHYVLLEILGIYVKDNSILIEQGY